jgi:hypothetical protein
LGRVVGPCGWAVWLGRVVGPCGWAVWLGRVVGPCGWAVWLGRKRDVIADPLPALRGPDTKVTL